MSRYSDLKIILHVLTLNSIIFYMQFSQEKKSALYEKITISQRTVVNEDVNESW